jgi:2,5-diamino-6-(ribosylamino)-4(3H)-pyrimidinone 5'-phosphate reductase
MYERLTLPTKRGRPFFYTNFVQTVDGKVQVTTDPRAYWPIGSRTDYAALWRLRAQADVLIHGKRTATWLRHVDKLGAQAFQRQRRRLGKRRPLLYIMVSGRPSARDVAYLARPPAGVETLLVTTATASLPARLPTLAVRLGRQSLDVSAVSRYLSARGHRRVLVEGGPTLLSAFLAADLLDEVFVTIAPKIFGNARNSTLTMVEGRLFSPNAIPALALISAKTIANEVYLRYRVRVRAASRGG